ncbi:MAG: hypothetical protein ACJ741_01960 [Pyrinomonadaceae bacterium]
MRVKIRQLLRKCLWRPVEYVVVSALKTAVMCVLFLACAGVVMHWLGYPVPTIHQLQQYFENATRLSDILS